ncbi:MAG TPA: SNF2-related protein, partial [Candidatus Tumulicola sp.]
MDIVLRPALSCSISYDRTTGYFNALAFVIAADGIEALVGNDGSMRLITGCLTTPAEAAAIERGELDAARLVEDKHRGALEVPDGVARDALELLAWLVAQNRLSIRIAIPRHDESGLVDLEHIFHEKTGVFTDRQGDSIAFSGSANETPAGWKYNWESMMLCHSWDYTREGLQELRDNFQKLWEGRMRTARVIDVPAALRADLLRYQPPDGQLPKRLLVAPKVMTISPEPAVRKWREIRAFLSDTPALPSAIGLAPATSAVEPWPHQWQAFRRMYEPWIAAQVHPRLLIADEVGLGKTIEASLLVRQAVMAGLAKRVLVMVPASLQRQWQRELREKVALDWPLFDGEKLIEPSRKPGGLDCVRRIVTHWTHEPYLIASSHLLRRQDRREEMLAAEPWDLLIVDEAHHARREAAGTPNEGSANRLLSLLQRMRDLGNIRGLVLLTATPLQTALVELFDLLALLGLPAGWHDRSAFETFFTRLRKERLTNDDVAYLARQVRSTIAGVPTAGGTLTKALDTASLRDIERRKIERVLDTASPLDAAHLNDEQREKFREVARHATPIAA